MTFNCQYWNTRHWNDQCQLIPDIQPDDSIIFGNCLIQTNCCSAGCGVTPMFTDAVDYWNPATREIFVDAIPDNHGENLLSSYWRVKNMSVSGTIILCNSCDLEAFIQNLKSCLRLPNQKLSVKRCGQKREMIATWVETQSTFAVQQHFHITHIEYNLKFRSTKGNPFFKDDQYSFYDFIDVASSPLNYAISSGGTAPTEPSLFFLIKGTADSISIDVANAFRLYIPGPFQNLDVIEVDKETFSVTKNGVEIDYSGSIRDIEPGASNVSIDIFNLVGTFNHTFKFKDSYL